MNHMNEGINKGLNQVRVFQKTFGHPSPDKPTEMDKERRAFRHKILMEEVNEFLEADTLVDQIDANIDTLYVTLGNLVELGVFDAQAFLDIVQHANMAKVFPDGKPHYNDYGKVIKPDGWEAPEGKIAEELASQIKRASDDQHLFDVRETAVVNK